MQIIKWHARIVNLQPAYNAYFPHDTLSVETLYFHQGLYLLIYKVPLYIKPD